MERAESCEESRVAYQRERGRGVDLTRENRSEAACIHVRGLAASFCLSLRLASVVHHHIPALARLIVGGRVVTAAHLLAAAVFTWLALPDKLDVDVIRQVELKSQPHLVDSLLKDFLFVSALLRDASLSRRTVLLMPVGAAGTDFLGSRETQATVLLQLI